MTMPSSGALNMALTTSPVSVAHELGLGLTTTISMNQSNVRSLAGVSGTSGSTWSMNSLYGKSVISLASLDSIEGTEDPGNTAYAYYQFYSNGSMEYFSSSGGGSLGNWAKSTSVGSLYWIRFTETASSGTSTETGNARNTWIQLSSAPYFGLQRTSNGAASRTYTVDIASDSGGSTIVATKSVIISVEIIF